MTSRIRSLTPVGGVVTAGVLALGLSGCGSAQSSSPLTSSNPPVSSTSTSPSVMKATSVTIQLGSTFDHSTFTIPNPVTTLTTSPVYTVVQVAQPGTTFPSGSQVQFLSGSGPNATVVSTSTFQDPTHFDAEAAQFAPTNPGIYEVVVKDGSATLGSKTFTYAPTFEDTSFNINAVPTAVYDVLTWVPQGAAYGDALGVQIEQDMAQCSYIGSNSYPGTLSATPWTVPFDAAAYDAAGYTGANVFTGTTTFVYQISQNGPYLTPENLNAVGVFQFGDPGQCPAFISSGAEAGY